MAPPFFIVGNDRSGTTMLRMILDRGPDAAIPPESMFLTDVALPGDGAWQALMDEVWSHPKVRLWRLPGPPPRVPPGLDPAAAARFVLSAPFEAYARKHGKPRWGDKTPHYVHHIDRLLGIWPDARVVVVVRDGRDVALSLRRMPFGPNNAWAAAQWWARGIRAGREAEARHPGRVLTVRYEDLAGAPETHVPPVCGFLELGYSEDMLAIERSDRSKIVPDQAFFAALAGDELRDLGYPVPTRPVSPPSPRRARLYRRHNELMRNVNFIRLRVFQERGRELRFAVRRRLHDPVRRGTAA